MLQEGVICAMFIAYNKICTKLAPRDKEIKITKDSRGHKSARIAVIIHLHQAHQTQPR